MTTETTTTTDELAGQTDQPPTDLAGNVANILGLPPELMVAAAARLQTALATLEEIAERALGIETVLRLVLAGAPMTPKMRRNLQQGLADAGLDPAEWLT